MNILLYGKVIVESDVPFINQLIETLNDHKIKCFIPTTYHRILSERNIKFPQADKVEENLSSDILSQLDMVLSIGGDGTMLASALLVKQTDIPVLGINTGRMGFLANIDKENTASAIQLIANKEYKVEQRSMLKLESNKELFDNDAIALNDFTIQKKTSSSMITIHCYVNDEYFNSYWCNGLIVATPTGSTAFSMSCGGPIILPMTKSIVVTPIAPHNLNIRPVVLPDNVSLKFEIESRSNEVFCTLDSRFEVIHPDTQLTVKTNDYKVNLVKIKGHNYFTTLRNKLLWGKDVRNS